MEEGCVCKSVSQSISQSVSQFSQSISQSMHDLITLAGSHQAAGAA